MRGLAVNGRGEQDDVPSPLGEAGGQVLADLLGATGVGMAAVPPVGQDQ